MNFFVVLGTEAGDVIVLLQLRKHARFEVNGIDIIAKRRVSILGVMKFEIWIFDDKGEFERCIVWSWIDGDTSWRSWINHQNCSWLHSQTWRYSYWLFLLYKNNNKFIMLNINSCVVCWRRRHANLQTSFRQRQLNRRIWGICLCHICLFKGSSKL